MGEDWAVDYWGQGALVSSRERAVEAAHEILFFAALAFAKCHICVEVPDIPTIGDRHVAGIGPAIDDDDPVFAKQAVIVGVIDEARDEEFLLQPVRKKSIDRRPIIELGAPD